MSTTPSCIGIILDGNRRWAKGKGLPQLEGHRRGFENLKSVARLVRDRGVAHLVCFAFSTENWSRAEDEVSYLMTLFREMIRDAGNEYEKDGIRVRVVGQRERFASDIQDAMEKAERKTARNTAFTLWICLSYGSRAEITTAAQAIRREGGEITEESLRAHMWSAEMPDPDIIIRTGGEKRLSNFLLWQAAYSELFFVEPLWPDFSEKILDDILAEYATRERRRGK